MAWTDLPLPQDVRTTEQFLAFLEALRHEVQTDDTPERNADVDWFLEAAGAWLRAWTRHHQLLPSGQLADEADWSLVAQILLMGWIYE